MQIGALEEKIDNGIKRSTSSVIRSHHAQAKWADAQACIAEVETVSQLWQLEFEEVLTRTLIDHRLAEAGRFQGLRS